MFQHPIADGDDQSDVRGQLNKFAGENHATAWMVPTQERLETCDAARGNFYERLIIDLELSVDERAPEIMLEIPARLHSVIHLGDEPSVLSASLRFRLIERHIGIHEKLIRLKTVFGRKRHPDTRSDANLMRSNVKRLIKRGHQPVSQFSCALRIRDTDLDDSKFVPSNSRNEVRLSDTILQTLRNLSQERIAHCVSQAIVDRLEPIEV